MAATETYKELCSLAVDRGFRVGLLVSGKSGRKLAYLEVRDKRDGELLSKVRLSKDDDLDRAARIALEALPEPSC